MKKNQLIAVLIVACLLFLSVSLFGCSSSFELTGKWVTDVDHTLEIFDDDTAKWDGYEKGSGYPTYQFDCHYSSGSSSFVLSSNLLGSFELSINADSNTITDQNGIKYFKNQLPDSEPEPADPPRYYVPEENSLKSIDTHREKNKYVSTVTSESSALSPFTYVYCEYYEYSYSRSEWKFINSSEDRIPNENVICGAYEGQTEENPYFIGNEEYKFVLDIKKVSGTNIYYDLYIDNYLTESNSCFSYDDFSVYGDYALFSSRDNAPGVKIHACSSWDDIGVYLFYGSNFRIIVMDSTGIKIGSTDLVKTSGMLEQSQSASGQSNTTLPSSNAETTASSRLDEAVELAKEYYNNCVLSYPQLIYDIEGEGYTHEEAVYAADNCGADWFAKAKEYAEGFIELGTTTHDDLVELLEHVGFTHEEAVYGAEANGY